MQKINYFKTIFMISLLVSVFASCVSYRQIREMPIADVNLDRIKDGTYKGSFGYGNFVYEVQTTIINNKIADINILKNRDTKYAKMAEGVIDRIIEAQTPNVDAVSGATTTSKALMKAVESSLMKSRLFKKP